jgi:hypothetical protein
MLQAMGKFGQEHPLSRIESLDGGSIPMVPIDRLGISIGIGLSDGLLTNIVFLIVGEW